ncbi:uncharacterized protein N7498_000978 [Penicillium cinerascens]|uniref:Uncharacterized protein n=1 Tax=Penicillium cinerascens TaxID=70096 RepID=A0A9W9NFA9_9EURO|nr:uncharacterized protein N7498_000978 [Penicillium cinerascens]KAJ5218879.1 hypothetical protein N7498_000978 [Penicillium cinerascens]
MCNLRVTASDDEDIGLEIEIIESSCCSLKQTFILSLEIQTLQSSTQNPDLPLNCLHALELGLNRQEEDLASASGARRFSSKHDRAVNELLCEIHFAASPAKDSESTNPGTSVGSGCSSIILRKSARRGYSCECASPSGTLSMIRYVKGWQIQRSGI